jgi:replicative DNA helicase
MGTRHLPAQRRNILPAGDQGKTMTAHIREVRDEYDTPEVPHSHEAESAVLGSCIIDRDVIIHVANVLKPRDFRDRDNAIIYRAILRLYRNRIPCDFATIVDQLERDGDLVSIGGVETITARMNAVPTAVHANHYANIVLRYARQRRLIEAGNRIAELAYDSTRDPDELEEEASEVFRSAIGNAYERDWITLADAVSQFEASLQNESDLIIPTGFYDLDNRVLNGGLVPGEMTVIAARTGMGKSALALQLINEIASQQGRHIALVSLEMSIKQIVGRLAAINNNIDMRYIRKLARIKKMQQSDWDEVIQAMGELSNRQVRILTNRNLSASNLTAKVTRLHATHPVQCLIVDYLQLMRGTGKKESARYLEVGEISAALKGIALDLDIPVIALSQLSRAIENRGDDAEPRLSDLRESGNIEQDADNVIFLHRTKDAPVDKVSDAALIVAKQRDGITDTVNVLWNPITTKFLNAARMDQ